LQAPSIDSVGKISSRHKRAIERRVIAANPFFFII